MKYAVTEVVFVRPKSYLGSSMWMSSLKQGGYAEAEFDTDEQMLTLIPGPKADLKKRRIPVQHVDDMVWGPTKASNKQ